MCNFINFKYKKIWWYKSFQSMTETPDKTIRGIKLRIFYTLYIYIDYIDFLSTRYKIMCLFYALQITFY